MTKRKKSPWTTEQNNRHRAQSGKGDAVGCSFVAVPVVAAAAVVLAVVRRRG